MLRGMMTSTSMVVIHGLWQHHGLAAAAEARRAGVPYMVFPHGMLDPWALKQSSLRKKGILKVGYQRVLDQAKAIGFTTREEMDLAHAVFQNSKASKILIPLGVEEPPNSIENLKSDFAKQHPQLAGKSIVLFLGRLHPKKGCDLLIEAFAQWKKADPRHQPFHLRMAGPASSQTYLDSLMNLCRQHGLMVGTDVTFPGMIDSTSKWAELAFAKCLALPSHQENFGLVVAEALACGLPVLLSDKVNTASAVKSHQAGLVAPASLEGTLELLRHWSSLNSSDLALLKHHARSLYEKSFSGTHAREGFAKEIATLLP
jgi:glycosyltransferase involved in cell wall biosynthesis